MVYNTINILSFVVQNFTQPNPFFLKTRKFREFILLQAVELLQVLYKLTILVFFTNAHFWYLDERRRLTLNFFFCKQFWHKFRITPTQSVGTYTNTFLLSLMYWRCTSSLTSVASSTTCLRKYPFTGTDFVFKYLKPIPVLYFTFHKSVYNTLITYILKILVDYYFVPQNQFNLHYTFIFFTSNYLLYNFPNKYYFRLRH